MKTLRRTVSTLSLLAIGGFALAAFRPSAALHPAVVDDDPPPECPLCGGDPALHLKRLADLATVRFELAFATQMELR